LAILVAAAGLVGCVPRANLPPLPITSGLSQDSGGNALAALAAELAPTLYLHRDEPFPLQRVVAVVHPERPVIAYHLLWRSDLNGQWMPWTKPTDQEVVWVGYDPGTHRVTDLWTYWHGTILHADWRDRGPPAVDVQWGKHGSLPRNVVQSDLPNTKTLNFFYAAAFLTLPDILISRAAHGGPWGFFGSYDSYRSFTEPLPLGPRIDAVFQAGDTRDQLALVFGKRYSRKTPWPVFDR
jgi:hypothetical protein